MEASGVAAAMAEADVVVHCAALSSPWGTAAMFAAANVGATANVVAACGRETRLVHISTPSIYQRWSGRAGVRLREADVPAAGPYINAYAASKAEAEAVVLAACARGEIEAVVLRPRALFGPGDTTLLPRVVRAAETGSLRVIGSDDVLQDLTYIDNAVDAVLRAGVAPASVVDGQAYNITNNEPVRVWDALRVLMDGLGLPRPKVPAVPLWLAAGIARVVEGVYGALGWGEPPVTFYAVYAVGATMTFDISRAMAELGYVPRVSFAEGVARTMAAYAQRRSHL